MQLLLLRISYCLISNPASLAVERGAALRDYTRLVSELATELVRLSLARPMSCVQECFDFINLHNVGSLTISSATLIIKWV